MTRNQQAFLDMIAFSEIGPQLLSISDNGYNVIVGSTPDWPILFTNYKDHPRRLQSIVFNGRRINSTAAGRYQLLARYFDAYKRSLGLKDFSPESQDAIALQQIRECRAIPLIDAGRFQEAVNLVCNIWASLPGASYGQPEKKFSVLRKAYLAAGGSIARAQA